MYSVLLNVSKGTLLLRPVTSQVFTLQSIFNTCLKEEERKTRALFSKKYDQCTDLLKIQAGIRKQPERVT